MCFGWGYRQCSSDLGNGDRERQTWHEGGVGGGLREEGRLLEGDSREGEGVGYSTYKGSSNHGNGSLKEKKN